MAIKIPFLAEVTDFLRGTRSVEDSLDDVADALDDVGRAGSDVDRQVGGDLDRLADTADDSAERIERSFREAFDAVEAQGRTTSRRVRDDVDDVGRRGSTTLREFSDEAKQNVAETVSSFNGSASSAVDAIQGTFGGLVSALGPAGLIGAAAAAAGIGLARGLFERSKAAAQEVAEAVADITGQLIDLGSLNLGTEQVNEKLKEFASTAEDGKNVLVDLAEQAKDAGINTRDYLRGLAGDTDALQRAYDQVQGRIHDLDKSEQDLMHTRGVTQDQVDALVASHLDERAALQKARDELVKQDSTLDLASDAYRTYQDATRDSTQALEDQTGQTQAATDKAKGLDEALGRIPAKKSTTVEVDVDAEALARFNDRLQRYLNGKTYYVTLQPRPGKSAYT